MKISFIVIGKGGKMILRNWIMIEFEDSWRLVGQIYGHERIEDGEMIRTAKVVSFNVYTMIAHTVSGASYELKVMSEEFAQILKKNRKRLKDFHNP